MKRTVTLLAVLSASLLASGCTSLPTFAPSTNVSSTGPAPAAADEWEYLVVSNGKVYFGNPSKQSTASVAFSEEATSTQSALDKLGQEGWELVGVVGLIGGDQEFLLKRR
ncbi:MAG TPA: hypothetical protein V6D05_07700, partial [Stenomitos sp.]